MHGKYRFAALGLVLMLAFCTPGIAQRLPLEATPVHYQLTLTPDFVRNKYTGDEVIRVRILKPTSSITLNALEIEFEQANITSDHETMNATVAPDSSREMATLKVSKVLQPGPAEIHIRFKGILNDKLRGFYRAHENGRKYATTQFEPTDARRAFPCFDEPALKATFEVTLVVASGLGAYSNSKVVSEAELDDGRREVTFARTMKMSTYLVAFIVGEFVQTKTVDVGGIPLAVVCRPDQVHLTGFALDVGAFSLRFFGEYF